MVNMLVIGAVFIFLLLIMAGFLSQQFSTAQKIKDSQRPQNLLEKMNKGIGALNTAKFRQIVLEGGLDDQIERVDPLLDQSDQTGAQGEGMSSGEMNDDLTISDELANADDQFDLGDKDLQTIYSEYLSEKNVNPFDLEPEFRLGVAYLKFGQFEKSISQFQKVIDGRPEFPGIYYYLGEAHRCNGQFYEAMKAYKQSWETDSRIDMRAETQQPVLEKPSKDLTELQQ